ncbi:MAG: thermonuclease family protein [Proteobacteria bacterium]|jgi:endonuclease YncB( thermonuclease family)|nr:thermonuclease family protein [Pseudomonadota bacterium]
MSAAKTKPRSKAALAGLLVAALAGFAAWWLLGEEPVREAERSPRARAPSGSFSGEVVAVLDGDTVDVMHEGRAVRVRLAGIDCPEKKQPFGKKAKRRASELAFGRVVRVSSETRDRYGRAVGKVALPDGGSLNEILVRDGLAWWYRQYSKDTRLGELEAEAKAARRGLWADPDPTPPWEYRRERRKSSKGG